MSDESYMRSLEIKGNWIELSVGNLYHVKFLRGSKKHTLRVIADSIADAYDVAFGYLNDGHEMGAEFTMIKSIREADGYIVIQADLADLEET